MTCVAGWLGCRPQHVSGTFLTCLRHASSTPQARSPLEYIPTYVQRCGLWTRTTPASRHPAVTELFGGDWDGGDPQTRRRPRPSVTYLSSSASGDASRHSHEYYSAEGKGVGTVRLTTGWFGLWTRHQSSSGEGANWNSHSVPRGFYRDLQKPSKRQSKQN